MEIEYPDSGNDGHFISWTGEATPGVLITVPDIMLGWSYQLQYSCMNKPGPETQGGINTRSMWHVFFRWENTQRNGSQKRELLGRSGGLTGNYTHPKNSYYMCQARPWGQETCNTEQGLPLRRFQSYRRKMHRGERHPHIYTVHTLLYFHITDMKSALQKKKGSRVLYLYPWPQTLQPAPSPLRFFSDAGLSLWSKQRLFFLRKGNHKVSSNLCTHQTPLLGCKCWCQEWFHNQGCSLGHI